MNIWSDDRIASLDDQIRDVETYSRLLTKGDDVTLGRSHPSWATMIRRESMMEKTLDMEIYICIYTHNVCLQPVRDSQSFLWGQEREFLCWKQLEIGEIVFRSDVIFDVRESKGDLVERALWWRHSNRLRLDTENDEPNSLLLA